jgi:putative membrane protein
LKTVFAIFFRDLKRLIHNPAAVIVALGVCVLPSLYAWFNIIANWDPYKNTSDIAIAIVNEDAGADISGMGHIDAGDMVVDELRENTQLGWKFVDEDTAMDGVKSGTYYAAIVIPSDFTSTLAGVLDGKTDKAHIQYYANEKANAVAPKVTDTGASTIETQIDATFVETVGKVVGEKIADAAGNAKDTVVDGSHTVAQDVRDAQGLLDGLGQDLTDAQTTIDTSKDALDSAASMLADADSGAADAATSLRSALGTLTDTRSQARTLNQQLGNSLLNGAGTISSLSTNANVSIADAAAGIERAQGKVDNALSVLEDANTQTQSVLNSVRSIRDGIAALPASDIRDQVLAKLDAQIDKLQTLVDDQTARIQKLQDLSDSIKNDTVIATDLSSSVNTAIQDSATGLQNLDSDLQSPDDAGTRLCARLVLRCRQPACLDARRRDADCRPDNRPAPAARDDA